MDGHSLAAFAAAAMMLALPVNGHAAPSRFTPAPDAASLESIRPVFIPLGLRDPITTVVVEVAGDPVAVASANALVPFTREEKQAHKDRVRSQQRPIEDQVWARGGTVVASYQSAYNGVRVRIAASKARELASIPGVVAVHPLQVFKPDNTHGVPLIGAPFVWGGVPGLRGEGIKVAIIDTGIDYTHADFGGPGTAAAYTAAHAQETLPADPALFGPAAPKVKGGTDLVGDAYNASAPAGSPALVPHPDPNPLDCAGHGSHVAGTAVGFGVLADGSTFTGPYDATTIGSHSWNVGPGVAPGADLYSIRVFGCAGSTDVVVDAIDWAVDHDMDVINMSLGSPFGSADDPSAVAASNAAKAGVIVVASAGNNGTNPYITGSPASGTGGISVAASDPTPSFPAAVLAFGTGASLTAIDANGAALPGGSLSVVVLRDATRPGGISLGCNPAEYVTAGVAGKVVVTQRGTCARVARAVFGQKAGAVAVVMLNNANAFPPFEGPITGNPDTGEQFNVTIPLLGVPRTTAAPTALSTLLAADGSTVTLTPATLANPGFRALASFTSGGPRTGDSALKPEVTAPGVSIFSVAIGTGNQSEALSGTSMAAPHTTGAAALVRQAHPDWKFVRNWKAALVNTADPAGVASFSARNAGAGLVQVQSAAKTQVIAVGVDGGPVLNFGFAELDRDFRGKAEIKVRNLGTEPATFDVAAALGSGSPHTVALRSTRITVKPHEDAEVGVELSVPAATAGDSSAFSDISGVVSFTPVGGSNGGVALRVPYYLVPQAVSDIATRLDVEALVATGSAGATTTNEKGVIPGAADWYAWGLASKRAAALGSNDLRAVGVQTFPPTPPATNGVLAFAISTFKRWSNAAMNEFDIAVDVDGDGIADYTVVGVDLGAIQTGSFNGQMAVAVFATPIPKVDEHPGVSVAFLADAPTDSTSIVLPVRFSQLCRAKHPCLNAANPRFSYSVASFGLTDGTQDVIPATATFNAFTPSISNGMFDVVNPGGTAVETVSIDAAEFAKTPALGVMIVTHDNPSVGQQNEAQLIGLADGE